MAVMAVATVAVKAVVMVVVVSAVGMGGNDEGCGGGCGGSVIDFPVNKRTCISQFCCVCVTCSNILCLQVLDLVVDGVTLLTGHDSA